MLRFIRNFYKTVRPKSVCHSRSKKPEPARKNRSRTVKQRRGRQPERRKGKSSKKQSAKNVPHRKAIVRKIFSEREGGGGGGAGIRVRRSQGPHRPCGPYKPRGPHGPRNPHTPHGIHTPNRSHGLPDRPLCELAERFREFFAAKADISLTNEKKCCIIDATEQKSRGFRKQSGSHG